MTSSILKEKVPIFFIYFRLVAANTGAGVYKNDGPYAAYISLNKVTELQGVVSASPQLVLGANTTITNTINILRHYISKMEFLLRIRDIKTYFRIRIPRRNLYVLVT